MGKDSAVLEAFRQQGSWEDYKHLSRSVFPDGSYGNGAAMRVAPVGLFFHHQPELLLEQARLSAIPTHVHPWGIEGAILLAASLDTV